MHNHLAVALGQCVYLWNASSGSIDQLMELEQPEEYVSSLGWVKEGNVLALGTSSGNVQVRLVTIYNFPSLALNDTYYNVIVSCGTLRSRSACAPCQVTWHALAACRGTPTSFPGECLSN